MGIKRELKNGKYINFIYQSTEHNVIVVVLFFPAGIVIIEIVVIDVVLVVVVEVVIIVKLRLLYCHPPQLRPAIPGL